MKTNVFAEKGFIHILGPSPALVPAGGDAWDGWLLECCDIFKDDDTYHWYYHAQGDDSYHPNGYRVGVATAEQPEGPWEKNPDNPIFSPGDWGAWDDGGYSEAAVRYSDGVFHLFYGGAKTWKLESIGYAHSFDGYNFTKYAGNPVVTLQSVPDASGFAEVKALIEPPFIYLYHTLRYFNRNIGEDGQWIGEDLGMQVLSTSPTFRLPMPVLCIESLGASQTTANDECIPIGMQNVESCALTVECEFDKHTKNGLRLHLRSSYDGLSWDTRDMKTFDIEADAGGRIQETMDFFPTCRFFKVLCENLDDSSDISQLKVAATLGR